MADQISNDDVKKMLEMLKEHTEAATEGSDTYATQTTKEGSLSDDDIKNMLKKHFSAEDTDAAGNIEPDGEYSFDSEDFVAEEEEMIPEEEEMIPEEEEMIPEEEEIIPEEEEIIPEEEETLPEEEEIIPEEEETLPEEEEIAPEEEEIVPEEEEIVPEEEEIVAEEEEIVPEEEEVIPEEEEIISDEQITLPEEVTPEDVEELATRTAAIESRFEEELAEDLKDFDALLDEHLSDEDEKSEFVDEEGEEQLQIFEDPEEFVNHGDTLQIPSNAPEAASERSEYFDPDEDLDAIDIALMMALGGEEELNQTMGFEKIRQAVNDYDEKKDTVSSQNEAYGYCGEEYKKKDQRDAIRGKYAEQRSGIATRLIGTLSCALVLLIYEITGYIGIELPLFFGKSEHFAVYVLFGLQLLVFCAAFSYKKILKCFKGNFDVSTATCFSAMALLIVNVINDICIIAFGGNEPLIYHSAAALLFVLSVCYDMLIISRQKSAFEIVSAEGTKFVLEPYGRIKINEKEVDSDDGMMVMDKDSYFASKTEFVDRYFSRTGEVKPQSMSQITALILSLVLAFVVMLVLILLNKSHTAILSGFSFTVSFSLIAAALLESEYAFFVAQKRLKKIKSTIVGKASAFEYGNCDLIYFDDVDVFDKRSVKTKGLKLYDNNEIYRVLYNTQAVFSKIGGPLRTVFEYATTEMAHSRDVVIKDITGEGVIAFVDSKTQVLIGSGAFMKSQGLSPRYTGVDMKSEESGEESIMLIALNGVICAKLYVTYKFSRSFEATAKKLNARGINIGIRSSDPNVNIKWANRLSKYKKCQISIAKPTVKELKVSKRSSDSGVVSALSSRAAIETLIMCLRLCDFERLISNLRIISVIGGAALSLILLLFSGVNTVSLLVMALYSAACVSASALLSYIYTKR